MKRAALALLLALGCRHDLDPGHLGGHETGWWCGPIAGGRHCFREPGKCEVMRLNSSGSGGPPGEQRCTWIDRALCTKDHCEPTIEECVAQERREHEDGTDCDVAE